MAGYVVSRPHLDSNVGSNLASLAGAFWLAKRLSRAVIVDWRGLTQLSDPSLNYFTEFFEHPDSFLDVPVGYPPETSTGDYDFSTGAEWVSPSEARALGSGCTETTAEHVVLQPYHGLDRVHPGPEPERRRLLRSFYRELRPSAEIRDTADAWWREHVAGSFVVGLNVRTGNGRYFDKGMQYASRVDISVFENRRRFLRRLEHACSDRMRLLPRSLRDDFLVFYATDSEWMSELLGALPNSVTRRSVFPPAGAGDTFCFDGDGYSDHDSIVDTLTDMFLLARTDALVYNSSLFNQYARVSTGYYGGNLEHIEELFVRSRLRRVAADARTRAWSLVVRPPGVTQPSPVAQEPRADASVVAGGEEPAG
ncbi:MAG: nodulation protein NodZ [Gaiellaceae bacterium]